MPGTGRAELEEAAEHIANAWKCQRVSGLPSRNPVGCGLPGLRRDTLLEQLSLADAPAAMLITRLARTGYGSAVMSTAPTAGWTSERSGVCVGGQPGGGKARPSPAGKPSLRRSPAVQFANVDGKGAGEFDDFEPRAWITAGDDMDRMLAVLEMLTGLMYDRLATVRDFTGGKKNIWTVGVSGRSGRCSSRCSMRRSSSSTCPRRKRSERSGEGVRSGHQAGGELVRKGGSVGMCSVFATQKPTSDSLPSIVAANCALSVAFSLKTLDAAKATLGPDIGEYPSLSPVSLSLPDYAGVCVVSLRDGMAPFTRLRSPMVTEDQAAAVVEATAHLRRDPRASVGCRMTPRR